MTRLPLVAFAAFAMLALASVPPTNAQSCAISNTEPCLEIDSPSALSPFLPGQHAVIFYVWLHPCYGIGVPNPPGVPPVACDDRIVWEETNGCVGLQRSASGCGPADTILLV
ncbi:MAG: hypothetical protein ACYDCK_04540 [Thermoplasmatota archaeon]